MSDFPGEGDIESLRGLLGGTIVPEDLKPLLSSGLTHDHIVVSGTEWMLRVPRRNQLGLEPLDYLAQQKSCYDTAAPSGATPACAGFIPPSDFLPNGALVIRRIDGRRVESENDLSAVARCLGALSSITAPPPGSLVTVADRPFGSQWIVIHDVFGSYFDSPVLDSLTRQMLQSAKSGAGGKLRMAEWQLKRLKNLNPGALPMGLIGADSHLGNYLIDKQGKAWFVDLEFLTFDVSIIDAADAVSPLTLRLDSKNKFTISPAARQNFYQTWIDSAPQGKAIESLIPLAEWMITLRTLAWMCYWVDQGRNDNNPDAASRQNWDKLCAETLTPLNVWRLMSGRSNVSLSSAPSPAL